MTNFDPAAKFIGPDGFEYADFGDWMLRKPTHSLYNQIKAFPPAPHDDQLDALCHGVKWDVDNAAHAARLLTSRLKETLDANPGFLSTLLQPPGTPDRP